MLAVPGRLTDRLSDGCNYLISQGAGVVLDVSDVLDRLWKVRREADRGAEVETDMEDEVYIDEDPEFVEGGMELPFTDPVEAAILDIVDVIPISAAGVLEKLGREGIDMMVQELMTKLFDMSNNGQITQSGVYFMKKSDMKKCRNYAIGNGTEASKVNMQII